MKKYLNYFKIPFIITAVIVIICLICVIVNGSTDDVTRFNNETDLQNSVFDYAGCMTDYQVEDLEKIIANVEDRTHIDIAVVILNDTLEDKGYVSSDPSRWVKEFADDFADDHAMGYEKPYGSNIVFVDNLYREPSTGRVYSWMSTYGKAKDELSTSDCEAIMDKALAFTPEESDPDKSFAMYSDLVSLIVKYQGGSKSIANNYLKPLYIMVFSLIVTLIYIACNWKSKAGVRTTESTTYVQNGKPNITEKRDIFLRKSVTKVRRESSSGGGGGGGGHGGGGHSR